MINNFLNEFIKTILGIDIKSLLKEKEGYNNHLSSLENNIVSLRDQLMCSIQSNDDKSKEIELLQSTIKSQEGMISSIEKIRAELFSRNKHLKDQVAELATANQNLTAQLSLLETSANELKKEAEVLKEKVEAEKREKERAQEELADVQTKKDAEIKDLTDRIEELSETLQQTPSKSEEMLLLEQQIQTLEEAVQKLQRDKELLQDEIGRKDSEINEITDALNAERNEVDNLKSDNAALKERLEVLIANKEKEEVSNTEDEEEETNEPITDVGDADEPQEVKTEEPQEQVIQEPAINRVPERRPNKQKEVEVLERAGDCIEDFPEIKNEGHSVKRSIEFVYDTEGQKIYADDFFTKSTAEEIARVSRKLAEADRTGAESWTCGMCHAKVKVAHRTYNGVESLFFIHASRDHYCPWIKLSEKSIDTKNVVEEDLPEDDELIDGSTGDIRPFSRQLKEKIFSALTTSQSREQGVSNVKMDTIVRSSLPYMKWRRPDLSFEYKGKTVVIEMQRRKTPLDTIVDKDIFYRLNNIHVLWVFGSDSDTTYQYMTQANYKNTLFANHRNVP